MAQRKPGSSIPTSKSKGGSTRPGGAKPGSKPGSKPSTAAAGTRPPAKRKPSKSIVNQKQRPWGLIIAAIVIVAFAGAIVGVVVSKSGGGNNSSKPSAGSDVSKCSAVIGTSKTAYLNENKCASEIKGVTFKQEPNRTHEDGNITYDSTPPVGGNHNQYWADCTGTIYPDAIANENAVHMLEHGAVWVTYNKDTIKAADLATLKKLVDGQDRMALSPYPDLKTPISLQAWGYQLFLNSASDPRLMQFVNDLRYNPQTTPEYGAVCSQPTFKANPSTFGHPTDPYAAS